MGGAIENIKKKNFNTTIVRMKDLNFHLKDGKSMELSHLGKSMKILKEEELE